MKTINLKLSKAQSEFMRRADDPLLIMSTGAGCGKSFIGGLWIITELLKGNKILAAAQTHGSLRKVLFDHIFRICRSIGIQYKYNKTDRAISINNGICLGFTGESPDECLGITEASGFLIDECARCPETLYHNFAERCRGGNIDVPRHRLISTPLADEPSAEWFLRLKKENPDCVIHTSLYENPFVSKEYIKSMEAIYPVGSPLWHQQVMGEDIASDFLNAIVKDIDFSDGSNFYINSTPRYVGMDVAGLGRDSTVAYVVNRTGIVKRYEESRSDTGSQESMLTDAYTSYGCASGAIDNSGGYGQGLYDAVKHRPTMSIRPITFNESPEKELYYNIRSEMYMELAQAIKDGFYVDREQFPKLVEELRHTKAFISENGKLRIIPKEMIRKDIGRSPDDADALALAVYAMNHSVSFSAKSALNTLNRLKSMGIV